MTNDSRDVARWAVDADPPVYLMATVDPDIAMVALENYIVATNSHEQRGRALRALADFMAVRDTTMDDRPSRS